MTNQDTPKVLAGELKFFNPKDGYGFIKHPNQPDDVYFSSKNFLGDVNRLVPGAMVQFELYTTTRGLGGSNVSIKPEKPYKLSVNFDAARTQGGTFITSVEIGEHTVYLSACDEHGNPLDGAYVFATREENIKHSQSDLGGKE